MRTRPTTELTIPYEDQQGNQYIIQFGLFPENTIGIDIPLVDVSLTVIRINQKPSLLNLAGICKLVINYLQDREAILYFYYDRNDDISVRDRGLAPQAYRSLLFNRLIDRYAPTGFVKRNVQIKDEPNDHFITLITHEDYAGELDGLYAEIESTLGK